MLSIAQSLDLAWQHYRSGRWPQAEQLYRQVLEQDPHQVDAWHILGLIANQSGRENLAVDCLTTALRLKPDFAAAHNSLGDLYLCQRKLADAVTSFRQAVHFEPNFAVAHSNLGKTLRRLGQLEEAIASLTIALQLRPDDAEAYHNLGLALDQQGKPAEAAASYRQALRFNPDYAEAHFNLGSVLLRLDQLAEAEVELRRALRLKADYAAAHFRLGMVLQLQGMLQQAVTEYQVAVRLKPDLVEAHVNLGNVLREQRKTEEAAASYQRALYQQPDRADAYNNLGSLLSELKQFEQAEAALRQALHYKPNYAEAHYNLGIVLWTQGRLDEAQLSYQQALREKPDHVDAHLNLGNVFKDQGRLDDAIATYRVALRQKPDAAQIHSNLVHTMLYHPGYQAEAILEECRRWNDQHARPLESFIQPHANHPETERRLRVGYVSPDLREHADSFFAVPLLSNHDHRRFDILCYADVHHPDAVTERVRGYADHWRSTVGLSDQQIADLIRADQIDILVDLKLHAGTNRLRVFARKPAPLQVAWLGYPGTTGLSTIDYRLTDPHLDPPGLFDAFYSEESIRLPETFWCYDPLTDGPAVSSLPARENGFITFGCLNSFTKVNDGCLALWAQVLRAVPGSHLLLRAPRGRARERVLATFEQQGIRAARVECTDSPPRIKYLSLYHRIDVGLDPSPYNGHTTSFDAFWMGVPTITLVGKTVVGRAGLSQLCNLGLEDLAAETPEQYVALAAQLAGDLPRLQELRSTLRERMRQSPLMDAGRFARNVEHAYREIWRRWCRGQRPDLE
jgi:protein O-GlcNAc transferase